MASYSFENTQATIVAPSAQVITIGYGAGVGEDGIVIEAVEDADVMLLGADKTVAHSLVASTAVTVKVTLLKTSPTNSTLMYLYNFQKSTTFGWGELVLTLSDPVRGDFLILTSGAFTRLPTLTYAKEAGTNEWNFNFGTCSEILGSGTPVFG